MEQILKEILPVLVTAINTLGLLYIAFRKNATEEKKVDQDIDSEALDNAERSAKISEELLIKRINDLKTELDAIKKNSQEEIAAEREARAKELAAEREARKKEGEYLRRRIKEAEREARDYRIWAAKLVKQVVEAGGKPAEFVPTMDDSDLGIPTIRNGGIQDNKQEK